MNPFNSKKKLKWLKWLKEESGSLTSDYNTKLQSSKEYGQKQQLALPTTSPAHQETCTSLLDSLIHQRADSRSKKN